MSAPVELLARSRWARPYTAANDQLRGHRLGRRPVHPTKISRVKALAKRHTIASACRTVGISPSTYYAHAHRAQEPRFPAIDQDWAALAETYQPRGLGKLGATRRTSIAKDVTATFQRTFGRPAHGLTLAQLSTQLQKLGDRSNALTQAFDNMGYDAIRELGTLLEENSDLRGPIDPAITRIRMYASAIKGKVRTLIAAGRIRPSETGGPRTDPRVLSAAVGLAAIFARRRKRVPTHRTSPATGNPISQFNRFALQAFKHFLPSHSQSKHALHVAMQQAAARLDWTDAVEQRND
jgi:hypothetical protein